VREYIHQISGFNSVRVVERDVNFGLAKSIIEGVSEVLNAHEHLIVGGAEMDFENFGPCAAMMNIHKDSLRSQLCMQEILATKVVPDSTVLDHKLLAKVYKKRRFTVFPSVFLCGVADEC
jgi:hypothetical protein